MAQGDRRAKHSQSERLPQLIVAVAGVVLGLTGIWLWWLGERSSVLPGSTGTNFFEPQTLQLWMRRIHIVATVVLVVMLVGLLIEAIVVDGGWRVVFLIMFGLLTGVAIWTGMTAEWDAARLWALTLGSKLGTLFSTDGKVLPEQLREARLHLGAIPAAMLLVSGASFWHYRRS